MPRADAPVPPTVPYWLSPVERGWWAQGRAYVLERWERGEVGDHWLRVIHTNVARTPGLLRRAGVSRLPSPVTFAAEHLRALRAGLRWEKNSWMVYFASLRPFLHWLHNPVADLSHLWRLPSGEASRRRWLTEERLGLLLEGARGEEQVLVALEGFNGLRRIEVLRLRVGNVDLAEGRMRVCGKGPPGGKWRTIPMSGTVTSVLGPWIEGKASDDRVLEGTQGHLDHLLTRAARRALPGSVVTHHDLRRTFGRVAYHSGMTLVDLRNVLGHASVDMTVRYIGIEEDQMRGGLAKFEERMGRFRLVPQSNPRGRPPGGTPRGDGDGPRDDASPIDPGKEDNH